MTCRIHGPLVVEPRSIRVYVAPGVTCVVVWICGRPGGPSGSPPDGPLKGRASVAPRAGEADRAGGIPSARTTSVTRPRTMRCILNTPPPPEASPLGRALARRYVSETLTRPGAPVLPWHRLVDVERYTACPV